MQKRSVIFSVALFLGVCYLWPWAIQKKAQRLEAEALAQNQPESVLVNQKVKHKPEVPAEQVVKADQKNSPANGTTPRQPVQLVFPVKGKGLENIISYFGDPREGGKRRHEGVDIGAPRGTAILAVADGKIEKVKEGGSGGKQIWMLLENGWKVYYAHLHAQLVREGQTVKAGDLIGTVGNTGNAINAGPHLHFCLYPSQKKPVNPLLYLPGQLSIQ
ncbi:M23 family metallopeptidase [Flavilitoribacter nigricans]|uniref:M23 family metallopeptidase n=1 Tax=Flavilitoribacter nigricans TaxID=70997 RepID=UPI001476686D|nr:M23 family metallopeptidase [Flavilitoribacter nigricans]